MRKALMRIGATEQPNDHTPNDSNGVSLQRSPVDQVGKLMMSVICGRTRETGMLPHDSMHEGLKQWVRRTLAIIATTITADDRNS
jgi:hypothetical protein